MCSTVMRPGRCGALWWGRTQVWHCDEAGPMCGTVSSLVRCSPPTAGPPSAACSWHDPRRSSRSVMLQSTQNDMRCPKFRSEMRRPEGPEAPCVVDLARETGDTVSFLSEEISVFLCPVLYAADDCQAESPIGPNLLQVDVGSTASTRSQSNHVLLHSFHNVVNFY